MYCLFQIATATCSPRLVDGPPDQDTSGVPCCTPKFAMSAAYLSESVHAVGHENRCLRMRHAWALPHFRDREHRILHPTSTILSMLLVVHVRPTLTATISTHRTATTAVPTVLFCPFLLS